MSYLVTIFGLSTLSLILSPFGIRKDVLIRKAALKRREYEAWKRERAWKEREMLGSMGLASRLMSDVRPPSMTGTMPGSRGEAL